MLGPTVLVTKHLRRWVLGTCGMLRKAGLWETVTFESCLFIVRRETCSFVQGKTNTYF